MTHSDAEGADALLIQTQVHYTVDPADTAARLDAFLAGRMSWRSRTSIQKLIQDGKVEVCRRGARSTAARPAAALVAGDEIHVTLPPPRRDQDDEPGAARDLGLPILFEDRWLVAVDKPPDVPVHPAGRNLYRTVISALHLRYRRPGDAARDVVPKLCHRLDLETSGVLLVAKDDGVHRALSQQFRERTPEKEYLAVVEGVPEPAAGIIDLPIGPARGRAVAMARAVRHDVGQASRTGYAVQSTHGGFALLSIRLFTGRHHQIRVHLAAIGHPIVGDKIYGPDESLFIKYYDGALTAEDRARLRLPRQALHAHRLRVTHPRTAAPLEITAPLPDDLTRFLEANR